MASTIDISNTSDYQFMRSAHVDGWDEEFMKRPHLWPLKQVGEIGLCHLCNMKRGEFHESDSQYGVVFAIDGWQLTVVEKPLLPREGYEPKHFKYESYSAMIADGWKVD